MTRLRLPHRTWYLALLLVLGLLSSCTQNLFVTKKALPLPSTLDVGPNYEYHLRKDDKVSLSVWDHDELSVGSIYGNYSVNQVEGKWLLVNAQGNLDVPKVGSYHVEGLTLAEAKAQLEKILSKWVVNPQLNIKVLNMQASYRDLQHYALVLIYTHRLDGQLLMVNPVCAQLLEIPAEVLAAGTLAAALPNARCIGQYLRELADSNEARGVARLTATNGHTHFVLYHSHVVHEMGEAPYVIGYGQDITDRVLIEQELKRAKKAAEKAAKARTTFLATMSHEIRTPLNGVLGIATLLAKTALSPEQQQQVAIIQSSGLHLLAVINDVLDVAKITSGKLELEHAPFHLTESVTQAVAPLLLQAQQRGLEFRLDLEELQTPWVMGDALRLNQIVLNLLSNAIKFTPQGVVALSIRVVERTSATISMEFCVTDTGIGIPPDKLSYIFESFTQANADTTRRFGGTGLGLNISRALVEQFGGQLRVTSQPDQGSCFTFRLVLPHTEAPKNAADELQQDCLAGLRVLLVEDNDINRFVARRIVQSWGGLVDEAPDGLGALDLFERNRYDVVLMDIQLPGMNGMEITQLMRQHPDTERAQTSILALTANAYQADIQQYLAAGMNDTLSKPFDEAELCHKIRALC